MSYLLGFLVAAAITMVLIPPLASLAGRLGLVDRPNPRKVHEVPVPRVGGVAMAAGLMAGVLLGVPLRQDVAAYLVGAFILVVAGIIDDRGDLHYGWKFLAQFVAVVVVVIGGDVVVERMVFCGDPASACGHFWARYLAVPFTILAMVGVTNAVNLSDGLDGLAAGTVLMAVATLGLLAYEGGDGTAVLLALVLAGTLLGFLRFNTHPARVFMGDTGSQLLGYSAAVLALVVSQHSNPAISAALPLLILALPVADTLAVMGRRLLAGRSPFLADRGHLHHRLLGLGLDHYEVVFVIYVVQGVLVLAALGLRYYTDDVVLGVLVVMVGGAMGLLWAAAARGWQVARPGEGATHVGRVVHYVRREGLVVRGAAATVAVLTPGIFLASALGSEPPLDVVLVALAVLAGGVMGALRNRGDRIPQMALYVGAAIAAYLSESLAPPFRAFDPVLDLAFAVLTVAVALMIRFAGGGFRLTTLDFLLVFVALLLPPAMQGMLAGVDMAHFTIKFIILCYAVQLIRNHPAPARSLELVAAGAAIFLAIRLV